MRLFMISVVAAVFMSACHSQSTSPKAKDYHEAVVTEVLQANAYTYLKLLEEEKESWFAVPKMQAEVGQTYYYKGGMLMKDFESKDLGRTFDEVYFLGAVSTVPLTEENEAAIKAQQEQSLQAQNAPAQEVVMHQAVLKEILQATKYTYLRVTENGVDRWLALPKIENAKVGNTYYYSGEMAMANFESKDLNRTFDEVFFVGGVSDQADATAGASSSPHATAAATNEPIGNIKIEPAKDGITIAKLFSNVNSYGGKVVKIKGKVTKFNANIMGKNWIHLQDGTQHEANMDITVTTASNVNVGDVITVEGKITLKKDFGAGYFYEVIMEDAKTY